MYESEPRYRKYGEGGENPHSASLWGDIKRAYDTFFNASLAFIALIFAVCMWIWYKPAMDTYNAHDYVRIVFFENVTTTVRDPRTHFVTSETKETRGPFVFTTKDEAMAWLKERKYQNGLTEDGNWVIDASFERFTIHPYDLSPSNTFLEVMGTTKEEGERGRPGTHKLYEIESYTMVRAGRLLKDYYLDYAGTGANPGNRVFCNLEKAEREVNREFMDWMIDPEGHTFNNVPTRPWLSTKDILPGQSAFPVGALGPDGRPPVGGIGGN